MQCLNLHLTLHDIIRICANTSEEKEESLSAKALSKEMSCETDKVPTHNAEDNEIDHVKEV